MAEIVLSESEQKSLQKGEKKKSVEILTVIDPLEEARTGFHTSLKLIISALTLVSALAWNEAIKTVFSTIQKSLPTVTGDVANLIFLFIYALVITLITVVVIGRLERIQNKVKGNKKDGAD